MTSWRACTHEDAGVVCGNPDTTQYLTGWRCPAHTPAALAGRPEAHPDPDLTLVAVRARAGQTFNYRPSDTALNDDRARQSGKRANRQQRAGSRD